MADQKNSSGSFKHAPSIPFTESKPDLEEKTITFSRKGTGKEGEASGLEVEVLDSEDMLVHMGPQHPSTHGVLQLKIITDGEIIKACEPNIGFLHRCFEKHSENVDYMGVLPFVDRLDYICAMANELPYCIAAEKLGDIEVPERAEHIRVVVTELNRIASHLLAFGTFGLDAGAFTPFMWAFRDREYILDILEEISGVRFLYNYIWIGGVARDWPTGIATKIRDFLDYFEPRVDELDQLLTYNPIFTKRTCGVGTIPAEMAFRYGITGVNLRATGVRWDLRKNRPYSVYPKFDFHVPIGGEGGLGELGDSWNRYHVRFREVLESIKIIRQAIDTMPQGDYRGKVPKVFRPPEGEIFFRGEAAKGELGFHLISKGGKTPYRLKCKSPSFLSVSTLPELAPGMYIADLVMALGSFDIVLGELDR
jgi:NADH-quinone oxidoreductase subunit D